MCVCVCVCVIDGVSLSKVQTHRSGGGGGWLGGLWGRSNTSSPVATSPKLPVQVSTVFCLVCLVSGKTIYELRISAELYV